MQFSFRCSLTTEFWTSFWPSLASTLVATILVYIFIEKRLTNITNKQKVIGGLKRAYAETICNSILVERIIKHEKLIATTSKYPLAKLEYRHLDDFLVDSIDIFTDINFSYLNSQVVNYKSMNALLNTLDLRVNKKAAIENKKELIKQAHALQKHIAKIIETLSSFNNIYKFLKD